MKVFRAKATVNGQVVLANPTAASVSLRGRLLTVLGRGVANARITLTDTTGELMSVRCLEESFKLCGASVSTIRF